MNTKKESIGFEIFWFLFTVSYKFSFTFLVMLNTEFETKTQLIISFLLAVFWAERDKKQTDLENQIFELKEVIKNKQL